MNNKLLFLLWLLLPLTALAQPSNDDCSNAITLVAGSTLECTNPVTVSLLNATPGNLPVNCDGIADDDVWYHFIAVNSQHSITSSEFSGTPSALRYEVFSGSCAGTLVQCGSLLDSTDIINGLTPGSDYYIRIFTFIATPVPDSGTSFTLCIATPPNTIEISTTQYTVQQLVEDVLMPQTGFTISNVTAYTGTNVSETQPNGIGYFTRNGSTFPFENGIILSTGNALKAAGPNYTNQNEGLFIWEGDTDLDALITTSTLTTVNATNIEFDFVPDVSELSFNFIYASEEYGTYQCGFSDRMAIFISSEDEDPQNVAVVPNTNTPISTVTIRNAAYNSNCESVNSYYFDSYSPLGSLDRPTNFNGQTVPITATMSELQPGVTYHIKIVIADINDPAFDSALFIEAGSSATVPEEILYNGSNEIYTCDDNNDGFAIFNLEDATEQYLVGISPVGEYNITYHETHVNAFINQEPLPLQYTNIINNGQTIYVRIQSVSNPDLYTIALLSLTTVDSPILQTESLNTIYNMCGDAPTDVTTNVSTIPNITQFQVRYYFTEQDALTGTSSIETPTAVNLSSEESIWARIETYSYPTSCFVILEQPLLQWNLYANVVTDNNDAQVVFSNGIDVNSFNYTLDNIPQNGPVFTELEYGQHTVTITNTDCGTTIAIAFVILPEAPSGNPQQTFVSGETLENLEVTGQNIQWYDSASEGTALPLETLLENNTTYYATQTINGYQSAMRLGVTANIAASVTTPASKTVISYPNPVRDFLTITNDNTINNITIYNTLGQSVYNTVTNQSELKIDMSSFESGVYLMKVKADNGESLLKVIKE